MDREGVHWGHVQYLVSLSLSLSERRFQVCVGVDEGGEGCERRGYGGVRFWGLCVGACG